MVLLHMETPPSLELEKGQNRQGTRNVYTACLPSCSCALLDAPSRLRVPLANVSLHRMAYRHPFLNYVGGVNSSACTETTKRCERVNILTYPGVFARKISSLRLS